jgi:hypothetical protein
MAMSATVGPRIEIYTRLVCNVLKPEYTAEPQVLFSLNGHASGISLSLLARLDYFLVKARVHRALQNDPSFGSCASDPVIQAAVAKLSAGLSSLPLHFFYLVQCVGRWYSVILL